MEKIETVFKQACLEDIDLLLELMVEYYEYDHFPFDSLKARRALEMILKQEFSGKIWLIQHNNTSIGYIVLTFGFSLEYHGRDAILDEIYIREKYRGKGIGKQALTFVEDTARTLQINALHLEVKKDNMNAKRFYDRLGFKTHDSYFMTKWVIDN